LFCVAVTILLVATFAVAGPKEDEEKVVALMLIGMQAPYVPVYSENLQNNLEAEGISTFVFDGRFDPQLQATQMEDAIAMKVSAISLFAADSQAMVATIKKAYDAGIPVIISNSLPAKEAEQYSTCYFGPNNYFEGELGGEAMNEVLPGGGKVVIIEGAAGQETSINRTQGFLDALDPGIDVIARQPADWVKDKATRVMSDFITSYGEDIGAVWAHSDDMAAGAAIAMEEAGLSPGDIPIVSLGGSKDGLKAMSEGWIVANIIQSPIDETDQLTPFITKVVNEGWEVGKQWDPYFNYMVTPVVTQDDYQRYLPGDY
jgi:ribose transport system substrate-binding protein